MSKIKLGQKGSQKTKGEVKKAAEKGTLLSFQTQPFFIAAPKPAFNQFSKLQPIFLPEVHFAFPFEK